MDFSMTAVGDGCDDRGVPVEDFGAAVLRVVARIAPGQVLTYGDVAAVLGSRAARQVGRVMAHEAHGTAWWRVVSARGELPRQLRVEARHHYEIEGTPLRADGSVDLRRARARVR